MSGRPDFTTPGTQESGQHVATQNRPDIRTAEPADAGNLAASSGERIEIYAPAESVYNVVGLKIDVPSIGNATSGNHYVYVKVGINPQVNLLYGNSDYNQEISYDRSHWRFAKRADPPDTAAQQEVISRLKATESMPMAFRYYNNSDATQAGDRSYQVVTEEVSY
jgi:hypothetical protein